MPEEEEEFTTEWIASIERVANRVFDERKEAFKAEIKEEILNNLSKRMSEIFRDQPHILQRALRELRDRP